MAIPAENELRMEIVNRMTEDMKVSKWKMSGETLPEREAGALRLRCCFKCGFLNTYLDVGRGICGSCGFPLGEKWEDR